MEHVLGSENYIYIKNEIPYFGIDEVWTKCIDLVSTNSCQVPNL